MNTTPRVSVILPNYNHARFLKERIDSILNQTFQDFELILLDDCSSDNSVEVLEEYRNNPHVSHIELNEQNCGSPFMQWEKGIRLAKGEYIWIAESDDRADPEFLTATVSQLDRHPDAQLCITGSFIIDGNGHLISTDEFDRWEEDGKAYLFRSHDYLISRMLKANTVYNASMVLFRKNDCLTNIAPQYRQMRYCGDWLFWIEQIRKGSIIEIHRKLNYFRKHDYNTTRKGIKDEKIIKEVAFIKNLLYTQIVRDGKAILEDKYSFYVYVKHFDVYSPERTQELLKMIAQEAHTTYWHYKKWKIYNSYIKHIKPLFAKTKT